MQMHQAQMSFDVEEGGYTIPPQPKDAFAS